MILVSGASGHLGKATIEHLLAKGVEASQITAIFRNEEKASDVKSKGINIKIADYENYDSMLNALQGIDKFFLVSSSDLSKRVEQHTNAINAAKEAGVKHIVYTSFVRKNETETNPIAFLANQHILSEQMIKESGIPYTFLLNSLYAETIPMYFGDQVLNTGIFFPASNGKTSFTARHDMAEVAANILIGTGHEGKEYAIANKEKYDMFEIATMLSDITGKQVNYLNPNKEDYHKALIANGVPEMYANLFVGFGQAIAEGEFDTEKSDLEELLGRKASSLRDYLISLYGI
jgi:NAD(P)H dehydrogenase (quinone)